jgi:tetratricopeptide (TPR) repeat protein
MYKATLIILLFYPLILAAQQSDIKGVISIHNSEYETGKRQYVPNAQVEDDFEKATPTTTDAIGTFKLTFVGIDKGKTVVLAIKKEGLQVVNIDGLNAVSGQLGLVRLSMAKPDRIAEYRRELYKIGKTEADKALVLQLKKKGDALNILKKDAAKNAVQIQQLQKEYSDLQAYAKNIEDQAQELARRFVIINLDDESDTYRHAFQLFTDGAIDKAIQVLDSLNLSKRLADNTQIVEKSDKIIAETQTKKQKAIDQIYEDISSSILKARLHRASFQFKEAAASYALAIQYDSLNLEYLNEYTDFLTDYGEYNRASAINQQALNTARAATQGGDSVRIRRDLAYALHYRANILRNTTDDVDEIRSSCKEAIRLFSYLVSEDTTHLLRLVRVYADLGQNYHGTDDEVLAKVYYIKALEVLPSKVSTRFENSFLLNKSFVLSGLGVVYRDLRIFDSATLLCQQAIDVRRILFEKDSLAYALYLSLAINNLATVYEDNGDNQKAIETLNEALTYVRLVAPMKPKESDKELARVLTNLFNNYFALKQYDEAEKYLNQVEEITIMQNDDKNLHEQLSNNLFRLRLKLIGSFINNKDFERAYLTAKRMNELFQNEDNMESLLATTLIFLNKYDEALVIFNKIEDKTTIIGTFTYFEKKQLIHKDFNKIRAYFKIN